MPNASLEVELRFSGDLQFSGELRLTGELGLTGWLPPDRGSDPLESSQLVGFAGLIGFAGLVEFLDPLASGCDLGRQDSEEGASGLEDQLELTFCQQAVGLQALA